MFNSTRVYSYRRFSSGKQASGNSLERQSAMARSWCLERGFELDEALSLSDLGVSAFTGKNVSDGALAGFLAAARSGKVPRGSILLLESLDRLSRSAISDAVALLTSIVRTGVRVVSMSDNKEWNETTIDDTINFLISVMLFSRAHEESSIKSKRVRAAVQKKRDSGMAVISASHGPGWALPAPDMSHWVVDSDKADSVRKVFDLAISGHGGVSIARIANQSGWVLPWRERTNTSKSWEHTGVSRVLRDRRVLGEYQPKRLLDGKLVFDGEPRKNYFPAIVSMDVWYQAQSALSGRKGPLRIRGTKADIFGGLLFCRCGGKLERKAASDSGYPRYYCLRHKAGLSRCSSVSESAIINHALPFLVSCVPSSFSSDLIFSDTREALEISEEKRKEVDTRIANLVATLEVTGHSAALIARLSDLEKENATLCAEIELHKSVLSTITNSSSLFGSNIALEVANSVKDPLAFEQRHKIYNSLSQVLDKIVWHDPNVHFRLKSGPSIVQTLPPEALKRAKRQSRKVK